MNTIKTVVFDLGGVLVDLDIDRCTGAFRSLGMDAVADLINPYYPAEMIGRLEHGVISFHEACDEMRRLSGTPEITDAQIAWAYGQFLVRIPVAKLRQIDALRFEHRQNTRQHSRGGFHAAVLANMPANDLAGRAADHKNIPGAQVRSRQQFFRCLACLRRNGGAIRFLNGVLFHNLPTFFIY